MTRYPMRGTGNWIIGMVLAGLCVRSVPGWGGWFLAAGVVAGTWLANNLTEEDQ